MNARRIIFITLAILVLVLALIIGLAAGVWFNNQNPRPPAAQIVAEPPSQPDEADEPAQPDESETSDTTPIDEMTLTISTPWVFNGLEEIAEFYMLNSTGVTIEVTTFNNDPALYTEVITARLMAGTADDLMDNIGIDHRNAAINTLLADWFPIMRSDPYFNEADYFMNVFDAASVGGRLFVLPTSFSYDRVAANTAIPELLDVLRQRSTISTSDMMEIHRIFPTSTPMFLHENHDVSFALRWNLHQFIDFENRTAHFDTPEFIEFITEAGDLTAPDKAFGLMHGSPIYDDVYMYDRSQRYLFLTYVNSAHQFLVDFEEEMLFSGYVPLTNDQGQLVVNFWAYVLNGQSDPEVQALAWDFIKFLQNPRLYEYRHWMLIPMPVYRPLARFFLESDVPGWLHYFEEHYGWQVSGTVEAAVAAAIQRTDSLAHLPMAEINFAGQGVREIVGEVLEQFHDGLITAEQAAADLQDRVTLALAELG